MPSNSLYLHYAGVEYPALASKQPWPLKVSVGRRAGDGVPCGGRASSRRADDLHSHRRSPSFAEDLPPPLPPPTTPVLDAAFAVAAVSIAAASPATFAVPADEV